jgi:hypothetical protein
MDVLLDRSLVSRSSGCINVFVAVFLAGTQDHHMMVIVLHCLIGKSNMFSYIKLDKLSFPVFLMLLTIFFLHISSVSSFSRSRSRSYSPSKSPSRYLLFGNGHI